MTEPIQAFPLQWPPGWRRIEAGRRKAAAFSTDKRSLSVMDGVGRVLEQLELLGVRNQNDIVVSTNIRLRLDGLPRSDQGEPTDPGAAVYWIKHGSKRHQCIAIDRYTRVADNLGAIAATLFAMRAIERHGGASILERAFVGFTALPAPEQAWTVLGLTTSRPTRREIDAAYARLASQHHPDRGGDESAMKRINLARDELYPSAPP